MDSQSDAIVRLNIYFEIIEQVFSMNLPHNMQVKE
jgi:hypothetical protein